MNTERRKTLVERLKALFGMRNAAYRRRQPSRLQIASRRAERECIDALTKAANATTKRVQLGVRIPAPLYERVRREAERRGMKVQSVIEAACELYFSSGEAERLAQLREQSEAAEARGEHLEALRLKAEYLKGL